MLKKYQRINLKIEKLAFGGDGIAKLDKMVVFVKGVVPGDEVEAEIFKIKKNYGEAKVLRIIKNSALRIKPKCKHFGVCGGCKMQSLAYKNQLKIKEDQVKDTLQHIGGLKVKVSPIIGCKNPWFYRNKMEFSFGKDENENFALGLHPAGEYYNVFNLEECFLQSNYCAFLVNTIRRFAVEKKLKPYHKNTGLLRSLYIREGKHTGEIMINLVISDENFPQWKEFKDFILEKSEKPLAKDNKKIISIYLTKTYVEKGKRTLIDEFLTYGNPTLNEYLYINKKEFLKFQIGPQSFFQPNTVQAEILYHEVLKAASLTSKELVFDLFCGTGTIGLFCASSCERVISVDCDKVAISNANQNAKLNNISNVVFFADDIGRALRKIKEKPDIIIVDPPRAGLAKKHLEKIVKFKARKIVYVSCNPTTLARDLKFLTENGYSVKNVQPVDMFPHTHHVEVVVEMENKNIF